MRVAYLKCTCKSKDRALARQLRKDGVKVRITKKDPALLGEARSFGLKLPFIVENGKARPL